METISIGNIFKKKSSSLHEQIITTGIQSLDDIIFGMQPSELVVVGGRPGMGKTSLALNMAFHETTQQTPVLYFALDATEGQIANALLSIGSKIPYREIILDKLTNIKDDQIREYITYISALPLYFNFSSIIHITEIIEHIREAVEHKNIKLVYIDYLQFIAKDENQVNSAIFSEICYQLKILAKELQISIILLSELNRQVEYREGCDGKIPQLSDLYGSARIEELADKVLMVFRPEYYHISIDIEGNDLRRVMQIHILKNKNGSTGVVNLFFDNDTLKIY